MNYLILASLPFAFWFGLWAAKVRCKRENKATWRRRKVAQTVVELVEQRLVLLEIREGRTEKAIELLEFSMDCLAPNLWRQAAEADASTAEPALKALRDLKSYRQRWPRQPRPELIATDEVSPTFIREVADETTGTLTSVQSKPDEGHTS